MSKEPELSQKYLDGEKRRQEHIDQLRQGADMLRKGLLVIDHHTLIQHVAAWIDAEATTLAMTRPFVDGLNAAFEEKNGVKSTLTFGRLPNGDYKMSSDTSNHAVHILNEAEEP